MSRSERDATRIVRLWLEEGVTAVPDHVLGSVLDQLPATPQRRPSWLARRTPIMNNTVRLALAAAAVVVVALLGYQFLIAPNVGGPPATTPTPAPTVELTPTPAPSEMADVQPPAGQLEPGTRYVASRGGVAFTFAVPAPGWSSDGSFWFLGHWESSEQTFLSFYTSAAGTTPAVFPDPCTHFGAIEFEDSLAGEAEAWASVPGLELVSGPSDVTVDGGAAKSVVIAVPEDVGCSNRGFWLIYDPACGARIECTSYPNWLGETIRIWTVDLGDGSRFTIQAEVRYPDASLDLEQEIQQIVDSIQFE